MRNYSIGRRIHRNDTLKNLLLARALVLALLIAGAPAYAQHGPSVYFGGDTRLYNPGSLGGPLTSKSFACSMWVFLEDSHTAVIFDTSSYLNPTLIVVLSQDISTGNPHLAIAAGDFAGDNLWSTISTNPIPLHKWANIAFAVTTSLHLMVASIDGISTQFQDAISTDTGPFNVTVRGNRWMVGSSLGPAPILPPLMYNGFFIGQAVLPFQGALDQLTCKFKDDSYIDILTPNRGMGFTEAVMQFTFRKTMVARPPSQPSAHRSSIT